MSLFEKKGCRVYLITCMFTHMPGTENIPYVFIYICWKTNVNLMDFPRDRNKSHLIAGCAGVSLLYQGFKSSFWGKGTILEKSWFCTSRLHSSWQFIQAAYILEYLSTKPQIQNQTNRRCHMWICFKNLIKIYHSINVSFYPHPHPSLRGERPHSRAECLLETEDSRNTPYTNLPANLRKIWGGSEWVRLWVARKQWDQWMKANEVWVGQKD